MNWEFAFKQFDRDYMSFEQVEPRLASRPDLHAMILLNKLVPSNRPIIGQGDKDIVYLDVDLDKLETIISAEQIRTLSRCGIHYDKTSNLLAIHASW